jgi:ABC-2 type transport system ATP-binding protein
MLDMSTLQIDISNQQGLNNLFKQLSEQGIEILSMRNKSNRLEELFISLLEENISDN